MTLLVLGLIVFFGVHSVAIVAPAWRGDMLARLGEGRFKVLYSVAAAVGFVLLIYGYGLARQSPVVVYAPPYWLRYVAAILLLPVFPMLLAAYLPGRIRSTLKHPMLAAVKLWAFAHLLANGTLADILLFGGFLAWAVVDRISLKRRASPAGPAEPASRYNDLLAVVVGLGVYVAFLLWLHTLLIGMPIVLPGVTA